METLRRNIRDLDFTVFGVLLLLAAYACVAILAATRYNPNSHIPSHILEKQIVWEIIGIVVMVVAMLFDYRILRRFHWWIYGISLVLLVAVYAFPRDNGARSWIHLSSSFSFQPSELAKIALIIWIATFMANRDEAEIPDHRIRSVWPIIPILLVPFALTLKEPALGQALVMVAIVLTMYTVFSKRSHFALIMTAVVVVVVGLTVATNVYSKQSIHFIDTVLVKHHILKAYQTHRILTWIDPSFSPNHFGYNIHMAQTAIGSGQLFGLGMFKGIETNGGWVPNNWTDYIFSAIGEEFGFVGAAVLIVLFLMLIYRLIRIAGTTSDLFGMYIVIGVIGMFGFQVFENIGMDMYLSPSTGITLPFISYGGTSLTIDYLAVGILLSVGLRRRKLRFN